MIVMVILMEDFGSFCFGNFWWNFFLFFIFSYERCLLLDEDFFFDFVYIFECYFLYLNIVFFGGFFENVFLLLKFIWCSWIVVFFDCSCVIWIIFIFVIVSKMYGIVIMKIVFVIVKMWY